MTQHGGTYPEGDAAPPKGELACWPKPPLPVPPPNPGDPNVGVL